MIKKISKIMWIVVLTLIVFSSIIGAVVNNMTLPYMVGYLLPYIVIVQIILLVIAYFIKKKTNK